MTKKHYTVTVTFEKLAGEKADEEILEELPTSIEGTLIDTNIIRAQEQVVAPHAGEAYRRVANHVRAVTRIGAIGPIQFRQGEVEQVDGDDWVVFNH